MVRGRMASRSSTSIFASAAISACTASSKREGSIISRFAVRQALTRGFAVSSSIRCRDSLRIGSTIPPSNATITNFLPLLVQRTRSHSSAVDARGGKARSKNVVDKDQNNDSDAIVLFRRNPDLTLLRTGVGFSCFHTAYWLWYVTEFIPLVNASPMEQLHIHPALGQAGLVFAVAIQALFFVYPTKLVSKLEYDETRHTLRLYAHRIPLVRPTNKPVEVGVGEICMDVMAPDTKSILNEHDGHIQNYIGLVGIGPPPGSRKKRWTLFSYMLDIRQPSNVPEPDLLMSLMLNPDAFRKKKAEQPANVGANYRRQAARQKSKRVASRQRHESKLQKILRRGK